MATPLQHSSDVASSAAVHSKSHVTMNFTGSEEIDLVLGQMNRDIQYFAKHWTGWAILNLNIISMTSPLPPPPTLNGFVDGALSLGYKSDYNKKQDCLSRVVMAKRHR